MMKWRLYSLFRELGTYNSRFPVHALERASVETNVLCIIRGWFMYYDADCFSSYSLWIQRRWINSAMRNTFKILNPVKI